MHSTPHSSVAATAHLVESERLLAALPLVEKHHRDHHLQLALVNAVLSIAASMLGGEGQTTTGEGPITGTKGRP
jgi:hypothetical protein